MKLTAIQIESALLNSCSVQGVQNLSKAAEHLNSVIEQLSTADKLETCHELALAQNVAVDSIEEYESDKYQNIYKSLYMRPEAPSYSTRDQLLRHMLDNEKDGKSINDGIAVIGNDKYWYPVTLEHSVNLHKSENYRIIK